MKSLGLLLACVMVLLSAQWAESACIFQSAGELTADLAWTNTDPVTTDTVNILRSTSAGTEKLLISIPYATSYRDTVPPIVPPAGQNSLTYYYEVQAQGPGGVSVPSNEICKTFFQGPPAPTSLTIK